MVTERERERERESESARERAREGGREGGREEERLTKVVSDEREGEGGRRERAQRREAEN